MHTVHALREQRVAICSAVGGGLLAGEVLQRHLAVEVPVQQ